MSEPDSGKIDYFTLGLRDAMLSGWYNQEKGELMTGFPVAAEDVVVDVGCGDGGAAAFCARQGAHVILADADAERLKAAAARLSSSPARGLQAYVTQGDPLPLADASVTRVICTEVLEHVDDPQRFISELVRVGRPGALYLLTVPGAAQEHVQEAIAPPAYFQKPNHIRIFESHAFQALVEQAGLIIEHRTGYSFYWSVWWALFWQTDVELGGSHPSLDAWASTWSQVLEGKDGLRIKSALDAVLPKAQAIVARKPG
ncbi:MAG: class I SAM-dependent methyltransferase [Caulobacteraceae bacterium]